MPPAPLIAESQDSFTITDHDAFHIVATAMNQDLIDTIPREMRCAEPLGTY
jgi:hypothetical protein